MIDNNIAVSKSAPGTVDAALDQYLGERNAPTTVDTPAVPSEVAGVNEAAPVIESHEAAEEQPHVEDSPQADGGEADQENILEAQGAEDQLVTITNPDGTIEQIPLEEFEKRSLRQADYTRKTQEIATEKQKIAEEYQAQAEYRKEIDANILQAQEQRNLLAQQLEATQQIQQMWMPQPPNEDLKEVDPIQYHNDMDTYHKEMGHLQAVDAERQRVNAERARDFEAQHNQMKQQNQRQVAQELDIQSPEQWQTWSKSVNDYCLKNGFSEQEMSGLSEVHHVLTLEKARRWDEAQAKKLTAPTQQTTPTITQNNTVRASPNAVSSNLQKAEKELTAKGSIEAAIKVLSLRNG